MQRLFVLLFVSLAWPVIVQAQLPTPRPTPYALYSFRTLAGQGVDLVDGKGSAARFRDPRAITTDKAGNLYVTEPSSSVIRKITPAGVVTTFAGSPGDHSYVDGPLSVARFLLPLALAFDKLGNLYVADYRSIRKITPAGMVSTFAGDNTGNSGTSPFKGIFGLAVDDNGNIYAADGGNSTITKVTPTGDISILAGNPSSPGYQDGPGSSARFGSLAALTIGSDGTLYVADGVNHLIRAVTPAGVVSTWAGHPGAGVAGTDGPADAVYFASPAGLAFDQAENLTVVDSGNNTIRVISAGPDRYVSTLAGSAGEPPGSADGPGSAARFYLPRDVVLNTSGERYVADRLNGTIRKISETGVVTTFAGVASPGHADGTGSSARFDHPSAIAVDGAQNVYVADTLNYTVRKIDAAGLATTLAGQAGSSGDVNGQGTTARFGELKGIAVNEAGNVFVSDATSNTIRKITPAGQVSTFVQFAPVGDPGGPNVQPAGLAFDSAGDLYVAGSGANAIYKVSPAGQVTLFAGVPGTAGGADGYTDSATFDGPSTIAVDEMGNVYVGDVNNNSIRGIDRATGYVSTDLTHGGDVGLATDDVTDLYIAEDNVISSHDFIYASVYLLGGVPSHEGSADGEGSVVRFSSSMRIAVGSDGKIYVADTGNNAIRVGTPVTRAANISTRMQVGIDPDQLIAGFIITGPVPKKVVIRALGPSIKVNGKPLPGTLQNPTLELHDTSGALLVENDDWQSDPEHETVGTYLLPKNARESLVVRTLQPGSYTAVVRGQNGSSGIGLVEVYDLEMGAGAQTAQISTRGKVLAGDQVMIGGFILGASTPHAADARVLVRAIGPELATRGISGPLEDPVLKLYNADGAVLASNDDWRDTQEQAIMDTGVPPMDDREAALLASLPYGSYTAIVSGKGSATGVAVVEVYVLQ